MAKTENTHRKKETFAGFARRLSRLSAEQKRAALEMSASLAGVSLRVSREFVEAVPKAARILSADDLTKLGGNGQTTCDGKCRSGRKVFRRRRKRFEARSENARPLVFQICTRQLVLSSSIALETFELIPRLAKEIKDDGLLTEILQLASEIANRSAKHSADFLQKTPQVAASLEKIRR